MRAELTVDYPVNNPARSDSRWKVRPWGRCHVLAKADGFNMKVIGVSPQQILSPQLRHRAEHRAVIRSEIQVVVEETGRTPYLNEHFYIPSEAKHRMGNEGTDPTRIVEIEIQTYFEEDDIARFKDGYGRV